MRQTRLNHLMILNIYRASKHMRIRILICENEHQYAKNLKNMRKSEKYAK